MKETIVKTDSVGGHNIILQCDNDGLKETFTYLWIGDGNHCLATIDDKKELQKLYKVIGKILNKSTKGTK